MQKMTKEKDVLAIDGPHLNEPVQREAQESLRNQLTCRSDADLRAQVCADVGFRSATISRPIAIIVCFHPDSEKLGRLITAIAPSVGDIIVFNNGGLDATRLPQVQVGVHVQSCAGVNLGIATALNLASEFALLRGYRYAVSFDQDSLPDVEMIDVLMSEMQAALGRGMRVAAIGPQAYDVRDGSLRRSAFVRAFGRDSVDWSGEGTEVVSLLITSGCLFDLCAWKEVPFDDRLFIDHVDFNWCWRLARHDYLLLGTTKARLRHELSAGLVELGWITLTKYNPQRRYFQCRNTVYQLLREPMPSGAKRFLLKNLVSTMIAAAWADEFKSRSLWQCARGCVHGLFKRLGPFR